ncbi:cytochrome c5 [Sulfuriferula multivorans]|uniref:Cytochrome c5 n=1 Tax=Sulfuriferula multivorans TaxID=1559896 RepID=A0A401JHG9_9PROT|nr:c-type cytochrome [Sulfuriferula multivorans]GBL47451.1 cytochrome c5 [Sulfuriferula multivorans]
MSDDHAKMTKTTPQQFFVALWAGMFAPIIAIALILGLIAKIQGSHGEKDSLEYNSKATLARIQPVGQLNIVDASAPRVEKEGKQVFDEVCTACHTPGALGAPKFGNKADWAPRIKQGYATLIQHAEQGIRQMPPRGGNPDLSDIEIARAVAYMADDAGAKFTPPEAPAAAPAAAPGAAPAPAAAGAAPAPAGATPTAAKPAAGK